MFRRICVTALVGAVLIMVVGAAYAAVSKGSPAPNFKLKGLDGKTYQLSSYKGKKAVVLSFYATWCPPCQAELPELQKVWKGNEKNPVQFIGVNVDGQGDVRGNARQKGLTFPVMIDNAGVGDMYGIQYLPTLFVIDRSGIVREKFVGGVPDLESKLDGMLARYSK